jgi:hypothetical protein
VSVLRTFAPWLLLDAEPGDIVNGHIFLVAARLSEDPNIHVAVVEAGIDYALSPANKPLVDTPGADTLGCGSKQCEAKFIIVAHHLV